MINMDEFKEWALSQKGYKLHNGVLYFYNFDFLILDECIKNVQYKLFKNRVI